MVSVAVCVAPPNDPEITTEVDEATEVVDTVNVADCWPAGTVTLPGTAATFAFALESVTTLPPELAAAERVTVPCALAPPVTLAGVSETPVRVGPVGALVAGVTVSAAV
jgi:hypothetical protein